MAIGPDTPQVTIEDEFMYQHESIK